MLLQSLQDNAPVAHDILLFSMVILAGIGLGCVPVGGVRLGVAGVLFSGLLASHCGLAPDAAVAHFLKDFGLVLFVFALGLQMGPSFFASLKKDGLMLNAWAAALVAGGALVAVLGAWLLDLPLAAAAGIFAGATTNTPALGAAQQALQAAQADPAAVSLPALAYAATYPLGVAGIIASLILMRRIFKVRVEEEAESFRQQQGAGGKPLERMNIIVQNPNLAGVPAADIPGIQETRVVISRIRRAGADLACAVTPQTVVQPGDVLLVVGTRPQLEQFQRVVGSQTDENLMKAPGKVTYRRVVLTDSRILGKTVRELGLEHIHNVVVTRVSRGDLIFSAVPELRLQYGDMLQLVGEEQALNSATRALGNAVEQLQQTKFAAIFAGILAGVLLGLYPLAIPGLPAPVRLGLAGGPLLVAILLSHLGRIGPIIMHLPINANRALRELGILLFLAGVGLLSGARFAETVLTTQGLRWVLLGVVVTLLPLLLVGIAARRLHGMNFMTLCGLLSGGMTDPPALAFASQTARNDFPAVAYAAVYPLTMLLRIIAAQVIAQAG